MIRTRWMWLNIWAVAMSRDYRIDPMHAFQIGMQGFLIRRGVDGVARDQGLNGGRLLEETIVLSHHWDDLGDDPRVLQPYPGLRSRLRDQLLEFDDSNGAYILSKVVETLTAPEVVPPLLPPRAVETIGQLVESHAESGQKANWLYLSLLRLLASGIAQTEYLISASTYRPMVDVVRRLSLGLARDHDLRNILADAQPEFLLGALASGSQELFPLAVPGLVLAEADIDVFTAANLLMGPPICFDQSIEQRRNEGIDMPDEDRVSPAELEDYLARAVAVLRKFRSAQQAGPTIESYWKMLRLTHSLLDSFLIQSYAKVDRARPGQNGEPGFGTLTRNAYLRLEE